MDHSSAERSTKVTSATDSTVKSFRSWVYALEWNELRRAVEFPLASTSTSCLADDAIVGGGAKSYTNPKKNGLDAKDMRQNRHRHPANRSQHRSGVGRTASDPAGASESRTAITSGATYNEANINELDLLQQMVAFQQPRTPVIHPRAIPYQPASQKGKWEHCPDYCIIQPRTYKGSSRTNSNSRSNHHPAHEYTTTSIDDTKVVALKHSYSDTFHVEDYHLRYCPRLLRWMIPMNKSNNGNQDDAVLRDFLQLQGVSHGDGATSTTVMGRHFAQEHDAGTLLSIPPTLAQQRADWELVHGITIVQDQPTSWSRDGVASHDSSSRKNGKIQTYNDPAISHCTCRWADGVELPLGEHRRHDHSQQQQERRRKVEHLLQLLKVASRGSFATVVLHPYASTLFAPWFDPTDRWFTLAMYLASRMEVALWRSFYQRQESPGNVEATTGATIGIQGERIPQRMSRSNRDFDHVERQRLSIAAAMQTLRLVFREEITLLDTKKCFLRDGQLWDLVIQQSDRIGLVINSGGDNSNFLNSLTTCPLLELGSTRELWRQRIRRQSQEILAEQKRDALLKDLVDEVGAVSDETSVVNNTSTSHTTAGAASGGRKKRKKGKRRNATQKDKSSSGRIAASVPTATDTTTQESEDEQSSASEGTDTMFWRAEAREAVTGKSKETKNIGRSRRAQNEHKVMALSILEDVLTEVFKQIGLEVAPAPVTGGSYADYDVYTEDMEEPFRVVGKGGGTASVEPRTTRPPKKVTVTHENLENESNPTVVNADCAPVVEMKAMAEAVDMGPPDSATPPIVWDDANHPGHHPVVGHALGATSSDHQYSHFRYPTFLSHDPTATIRTSNLQGFSVNDYGAPSPGLFGSLGGMAWEMPGYSESNNWGRLRGFDRDESILTEFFHSQKREEGVQASSTAASIASSDDEPDAELLTSHDTTDDAVYVDGSALLSSTNAMAAPNKSPDSALELRDPVALAEIISLAGDDDMSHSQADYQSPSPPSTPSPTLSPILISLSDISSLPRESIEELSYPSGRSLSSEPTAGFQATESERPLLSKMVSSLSRDNLRASFSADEPDRQRRAKLTLPITDKSIHSKQAPFRSLKSRDDHDILDKSAIRRSADALSSYRNVALRSGACVDDHVISGTVPEILSGVSPKRTGSRDSLSPSLASCKSAASVPKGGGHHFHFESLSTQKNTHSKLSTRSETALDGQEHFETWPELSPSKTEDADIQTMTRDGTTTLSSPVSNRETDEVILLREQRNAYRDMCLTLGAEVAKLKNLLASQKSLSMQPANGLQANYGYPQFHSPGPFDPVPVPQPYLIAPRARTLAAMSDAGYRGEHESLASEDEVATRMIPSETMQGLSSGITVAQSDASLDHFSGHHLIQMPTGLQTSREKNDSASINTMQSRLARDIFQFIATSTEQMRKLDGKIQTVVERMNRLVTTVWPRAQVKLYGSHVTGLCVPTSDLDFVVCLPAVHKNAVAVAPGALEGRNAINETSQKLLARRLKGESWIDPRSMKLIDRTAVPVIKVATKDTRKQTLHLDISFDSPDHHGVEAAQMTASLMEEFPLLRPLVVVLKQFLIERSLLEAYTGGLSSYCLSLLVARYLQEQSSGSDVGSLLMGFLDFMGNHFDPRRTGVSVRHRMYFARPIYFTARNQGRAPPMWSTTPMEGHNLALSAIRRNSFIDKGSQDVATGAVGRSMRYATTQFRPVEFQPGVVHDMPAATAAAAPIEPNALDNRMPYTFDPLFVEDPLSSGNNVGRNAFRIVQVQRAFSDAHRALVAALEWDMHSLGDLQDTNDFPLLKCLLQSEDIVYDL